MKIFIFIESFLFTGRFDMKSCAFRCEICEQSTEATPKDNIVSGYRPRKADDTAFYLFDSDYLLWWYYLQN